MRELNLFERLVSWWEKKYQNLKCPHYVLYFSISLDVIKALKWERIGSYATCKECKRTFHVHIARNEDEALNNLKD